LRARCALAASRTAADPRALVRLAMRERARIARDPNPVAQPYEALLGGLITHAPELFDAAARGFDALRMRAHAAAAKFRRGELAGDVRACAAASDELRSAGIVEPERIVAMYAPMA
jgi:hypothetical protein